MYHVTSDPLLIGKWDFGVSSQPQIACIPSFETRRGRDEVKTRSKHLKTLPKNQTCLIIKTRSRRAQDASRRSWGARTPRRLAQDPLQTLASWASLRGVRATLVKTFIFDRIRTQLYSSRLHLCNEPRIEDHPPAKCCSEKILLVIRQRSYRVQHRVNNYSITALCRHTKISACTFDGHYH